MKTISKILCFILLIAVFSSCSSVDITDNSSDKTEPESFAAATQTETAASVETTAQKTTAAEEGTDEIKSEVLIPSTEPATVSDAQSDPDDEMDATGFVSVSDVIPDVMLDIRYYSTYNFIGDRVNGYEQPVALLSKEAASALKDASDIFREKGYRIKIFDAYRPQTAVNHFVEWASDLDDTRMKEYFYPELDKSVLFDYGYIAQYSGHSRGCTLDLTLFDMNTGKEVDMGGTFDYFGELSHPDHTGITEQQQNNRQLLSSVMTSCGFRSCATEWWDFTLVSEPYPDTYFTFPVSLESLKDNK